MSDVTQILSEFKVSQLNGDYYLKYIYII